MSSPTARQILLTGGSGQVGTEIIRQAPAGMEIVAPGRAELDLSNPDAIADLPDRIPCDEQRRARRSA